MAEHVLITDEKYDGKYVALRSLIDREVVASGNDPLNVMDTAKEKGIVSPVVFYIPEHDVTFVY